MRYLFFAVLAVGAASSAVAQAAAPVQAPATAMASEGTRAAKVSNDTASDADQAIRCRSVRVTGSLVKKGKVCKTLAEWRRMTDSGNDLARRLVEDGTSRPGGQ